MSIIKLILYEQTKHNNHENHYTQFFSQIHIKF